MRRAAPRRPWSKTRSGGRSRRLRLPTRAWAGKAWTELRAALRLPEPARPRVRVLVAGGLVLVLVAMTFAFRDRITELSRHPRLRLASIEVVGNRRTEAAEIVRLSGLKEGAPWLTLDTDRARRFLRTHPWVDDVRVERPWIGRVKIAVRECVPVAVLEWAGTRHGLAEDMRILPAEADSGGVLPTIRGVASRSKRGIDLASYERAFEYVGAIRRESGVAHLPVIVTLDPAGRDVILVESKGVEAILEEPVPPSQAVKNLAAFLETLDTPGSVRGTLHVFSGTTAVWTGSKV